MADIQNTDEAEAQAIRESFGIFSGPADQRSEADKLAEDEALEQSFKKRMPSGDDAEAQALEESFGGGGRAEEIDPSEAAALDESFETGRVGRRA